MKRIALLLSTFFLLLTSQVYGQSEAERLHGLGYCYQNGVNGFSIDLAKAFENYKKAAESGYIPSYYPLGRMLESGEGTEKNPQEAFRWYKKSAEAGDRSGQLLLAYCYLDGIGVDRNVDQAIRWFKTCADNGNLYACNLAGRLLEEKGSEETAKEAFLFYEKAAKANDKEQKEAIAEGQYRLAMCYINGTGLEFSEEGENIEMAKRWLKTSASHGKEGGKFSQIAKGFLDNPIILKPTKPIIDFIGFKNLVANSSYTLTVGVKANNVIKDLDVYLDGKKVRETRSIRAVKADGYDYTREYELFLEEGENTISVKATNYAGKSVKTEMVTYRKGRLASVNWNEVEQTTHNERIRLKADVISNCPIGAITLNINDISKKINVSGSEEQLDIDEEVILREGINTFSLSVTNEVGTTTTEEKKVKYVKLEKRLALVIGNSKYEHKPLRNPANDANDVAAKLEGLGFDVIKCLDADINTMDDKVSEFGRKAVNYEAALFYYAGHGVQENGVNYLLPIDMKVPEEADINLSRTALNANYVLDTMDKANCHCKIMILDACRDNPFKKKTRGYSESGLASMQASGGTLISFSVGAGEQAADNLDDSRNSPYTSVLLEKLDTPNVDAANMFLNVAKEVKRLTRQEPWMYLGVVDFIFNKQ